MFYKFTILAAVLGVGAAGRAAEPKADPLASMRADHVMVNTADFDRSVAWYRDKLGFKEVVRWTVDGLPGTRLAYLRRGAFLIEVAGGPKGERPPRPPKDFADHFARRGITHLCFRVDDVDAALAALNKRGVKTFSGPIDFPPLKVRVGFVQDPDGNVIEFKGPPAGRDVLGGKATWSELAKVPDGQQIRNRLKRWRRLWSQTGNGERYSLDGYEDLFVTKNGPGGLLVFDSYVPKWAATQIDGFANYRKIWDRDVNESFPGWKITRMDVLRVGVAASGEMAWSALNFWGEGKRPDGSKYVGSQHGTHVWRKVDGTWKIAHEHLTAPITVRGEANAKIDGPAETRPRLPSGDGRPAETDRQALKRLSREWIEVGFRHGEGVKRFSYEKSLSRFYLETPGRVLLHDNNDPQMRVATSARQYGRFWEELFPKSLRSLKNELKATHQVLIDGDLGLTSFTADAIVVGRDGESSRFPVLYTLGWKRTAAGWKIVHEHGSNLTPPGSKSPVGGGK